MANVSEGLDLHRDLIVKRSKVAKKGVIKECEKQVGRAVKVVETRW